MSAEKELLKALPVLGYRAQDEETVGVVNINKVLEEQVLRTLDLLAEVPEVDKRWLAIGRNQIEQGFMAVNRSIFRPTRFQLPEKDGE